LQVTLDLCGSLNIPPDQWRPIGAVFLKLYLVIKFNDTALDCFKANYSPKPMSIPILPLGAGLFLAFSMVNHSCDPSVYQVTYGTSIVLRARRPIVKGEQITICYGKHAIDFSYEERQKALLRDYKFKCRSGTNSLLN
jgi:hypothetical protein